QSFIDGFCERVALIQPVHHCHLDLARVRNRHLLVLEAQDDSVYIDRLGIGAWLPAEIRKGGGRWPVQDRAVQVEPGSVARTIERLVGGIEPDRAAEMRAVDRKHVRAALLILDREPAECEVAW